jgi:hypothetical protein
MIYIYNVYIIYIYMVTRGVQKEQIVLNIFYFCEYIYISMNVGPCHHGMARPQVEDGGTASYMEGSCE